jgi:hypothetical protein
MAEWVSGIAELIAVVVALFLPAFREKKAKSKAAKRLIRIASKMADNVIHDKGKNIKVPLGSTDNYQNLNKFIDIAVLANDDEFLTATLLTILEIINQLDEGTISPTAAETQLRQLSTQKA